eukprot:12495552-Alexandrium_andersonii.AAC.1
MTVYAGGFDYGTAQQAILQPRSRAWSSWGAAMRSSIAGTLAPPSRPAASCTGPRSRAIAATS